MPDAWEYPWFAAWDLAFHCVALASIDPDFAKEQLLLLCREWYMHPNGQLPAYEWAFGDVNPPVHAWAALQVFRIDGTDGRATASSSSGVFHKLLLNFTWWVNRKDAEGNNVFEGGFLGPGQHRRCSTARARCPAGGTLEQADAHRVDGDVLPAHAGHRARAGRRTTRPTRTSPRSSSSTSSASPR